MIYNNYNVSVKKYLFNKPLFKIIKRIYLKFKNTLLNIPMY